MNILLNVRNGIHIYDDFIIDAIVKLKPRIGIIGVAGSYLFLIKTIFFLTLITACQSNSENAKSDPVVVPKLAITYTGEADMVRFTMLEGLQQQLAKDTVSGNFEAIIEIPDLEDGIFTYDLIVQKIDSLGRGQVVQKQSADIQLNQKPALGIREQYLWIGKNRNTDFIKSDELLGSLTSTSFTSKYLKEGRELTIYTPTEVSTSIPYIYFTDGSFVRDYAGYVDHLITTGIIGPVRLIGIHSSDDNRFPEYVLDEEEKETFTNHEQFVFSEVLPTIEREIENWNGNRYYYGVSNGADFCLHAGINYPDLFEEIIPFSAASYPAPIYQMLYPTKFESREYPSFYMGAGRYEERIFSSNRKFVDVMRDNGIDVAFKEYVAGHDYNVWRIEFLEYIVDRFGKGAGSAL